MRWPSLLSAAALVLATGCATPPSPTAAQIVEATAADTRAVTVYFVPLDDFDTEDAARLARGFAEEFGVRIEASQPLDVRDLEPFTGTSQYAAEDILALATPVLASLPNAAPSASYVLLTNRDINSLSRQFRFMFMRHDPRLRASVVSTARIRPEHDSSHDARSLFASRLEKLARRTVGQMQFGWQRSNDIDSVMYSPIMNVADIDRIGSAHRP